MDFKEIDQLKLQLDDLRPLPAAAVKNLDEIYRVEWTYNSNAIEGNTLTLLETKLVLEDGLTIGGKKLKEHFEVINHSEAINYVKEITDELSEYVLRSIHKLLLKNIDDENAGRYRMINVGISGSTHTPSNYVIVAEQMEQMLQWYKQAKDHIHPVELAARAHFQFVFIHPFTDGNGRTARLLMNLILMGYGYPPAIVKAENNLRLKYYETLEEASINGNQEPFINLMASCVKDSLERYIAAVK
ncbi:Fic family protein [Paenibacillus sp. MWE-103]|uniref:Fic family protein n=1 Tax=Paenibacillus artemisiicola TaxID=1172618 RepID=A0ABS3WFK8_9BACL|nr:Fic family protein [Paenibacillus artemisiicola]MBO7747043.1 Fic family protein [Paenibacillus artemisiicola]